MRGLRTSPCQSCCCHICERRDNRAIVTDVGARAKEARWERSALRRRTGVPSTTPARPGYPQPATSDWRPHRCGPYACGPGSWPSTVPSCSVTSPRASVSCSRPMPSGFIVNSYAPRNSVSAQPLVVNHAAHGSGEWFFDARFAFTDCERTGVCSPCTSNSSLPPLQEPFTTLREQWI